MSTLNWSQLIIPSCKYRGCVFSTILAGSVKAHTLVTYVKSGDSRVMVADKLKNQQTLHTVKAKNCELTKVKLLNFTIVDQTTILYFRCTIDIIIDKVVLENTREYISHFLIVLGSSYEYSIHFDLHKCDVFCL